jgi:hypothetical protein
MMKKTCNLNYLWWAARMAEVAVICYRMGLKEQAKWFYNDAKKWEHLSKTPSPSPK